MAGPLSYALTLSTSAFTSPLRGAQGAMKGFSNVTGGATSMLSKMASPLTGLVAGLGLAATAFSAFKAASNLEQTQVGLRVLIGDVGKTNKLLKEVKAISSSTPFQFKELANSTRQLVAMDVAVDKIPSTLKRIGDVASGVQAPIQELALLYGRANNDGILYTETLNQFQDRGIPIFQQLAEMTGKNTTEVKKMAAEGKITFPMLEQSFMNLTNKGGKFHGMMKEQSETNAGLMSTLKDGLNDLLVTIGTPMGDALKPILKEAIILVKRVGLGLTGVVEIAKAAIAQGKLGELLSKIMVIGLKQVANYSVSTFVFMGELLFRSLHFAFKQVITFFTGGFNEAIGNMAFGLVQVFAGLGQIILSKIGYPLRMVAALFQASLGKALNWFQVKLANSAFGKKLGLDKIIKTKSFDSFLADAKKNMSVGVLKAKGTKNIEEGLSRAGKGFSQYWDKSMQNFRSTIGQAKFDKISILDTDADKKAVADLAKKLSPEGVKKLTDAWNDKQPEEKKQKEEQQKKADGLDKALANAKKITKEAKKTNKLLNPKGAAIGALAADLKKKKRRGVLNAAESALARHGRLAKGSKISLGDFVRKSGMNKAAIRDFAKRNKISIREAIKRLTNRNRKARANKKPDANAIAQKQMQNQDRMFGTVRRIEQHLDNLATV